MKFNETQAGKGFQPIAFSFKINTTTKYVVY